MVIVPTHNDCADLYDWTLALWKFYYKPAEYVTDDEALDRDLSGVDIVAFGTPSGNAWLSQYPGEFPFKVNRDQIEADTTYFGESPGLISAWPSPVDPTCGLRIYIVQHPDDFLFFGLRGLGLRADWLIEWSDDTLGSGTYDKSQRPWRFARRVPDAPRHRLKEWIDANHTVIDMAYLPASMELLSPVLGNHDVCFTGETRRLAANVALRLRFIEYLHQQAGVRHLLYEFGAAWARMIDDYLETGDEAIFGEQYRWLVGTNSYVEDEHWILREIKRLNDALPPGERLRAVGLDSENNKLPVIRHPAQSVAGGEAPQPISETVQRLRQLGDEVTRLQDDRGAAQQELGGPVAQSSSDFYESIADRRHNYRDYPGDSFFDFEMIAYSLAAAPLGRDRELTMYEQFIKFQHAYSDGKYYGQFGNGHVMLLACPDPMPGGVHHVTPVGAHLAQNPRSPVKDRVLSVMFVYEDCGSASTGLLPSPQWTRGP